MCGICGVYEYRGQGPVDGQILSDMLQVIHHRGPDDHGTYLDKNLALGMRRLSIIDLQGGKQPIFNEDGTVAVLYNGEIYNYLELADRLRSQGHLLKTASDTEVIGHLYEEMGDDCVQELRGMFAFALWDGRRRRLLAARDRLGVKPLYYVHAGGRLVFGSEIKAVLQHPQVPARLNLEGLSNFLSLKYVPAPMTMFGGVFALPPGHLLTCDPEGVKVRRYWDLSFAGSRDGHRSEEEYAEQLAELLRESVRLELRSDVPFGAFLSGGLDSSTVVALMSQFLAEPVKTFSVGFQGDGEEHSELPYARLVAERFETDHHEVLVGAQDFVDRVERVIWHLDQPIADPAALANYMVADLASRQVKMVLTGEGGDELFAGYSRYVGERLAPLFQTVPGPVRSLALAATGRLPGMRRPKILLNALFQTDEVTRIANWFPLFRPEAKAALLSTAMRERMDMDCAAQLFARHLACTDAVDSLSRMLYVDTKLWLPDDLLARGDKTSMAVSLEARVPLLDHRLVEFAAGLPVHLKLNGLTRKYLLKKVSRRWLPAEIVDRKKKGFPIPISAWFRQGARTFVRDVLSPDAVSGRGLFDPAHVNRLLDEHERGVADHSLYLWGLLTVEVWHRLFIDARPAADGPKNALSAIPGGNLAGQPNVEHP